MILTNYLRYYILITGFLLICFTSNALDTHIYQPGADNVPYIGGRVTPEVGSVQHRSVKHTIRYVPAATSVNYHFGTYYSKPSTISTGSRMVHSYGGFSSQITTGSAANNATNLYSPTSTNNYSISHIGTIPYYKQTSSASRFPISTNEQDFSSGTITKRRTSTATLEANMLFYINEYLSDKGLTESYVRGETDIDKQDFYDWLQSNYPGLVNGDQPDLFGKLWEYIRKDDPVSPLGEGVVLMLLLAFIFIVWKRQRASCQ